MRFTKILCLIGLPILLLEMYSCRPPESPLVLADDEIIAYRISPQYTGDTTYHLKIEGLFEGNTSGETEIILPSTWGGKEKLYQGVRNLTVLTTGIETKQISDSIYNLKHKPDQIISFEYELIPLSKGPHISRNNAYHPIMLKDYFHFIGTTIFVYPSLAIQKSRSLVSLNWNGFPKSWVIHNSFSTGDQRLKIESNNGKWTQSVFVGGDFRIYPFEIERQKVSLALRGRWNFPDSVLVEKLKQIITVQRDFWNDHSDAYYTVTLIPLNDLAQCCSYMGTGLTHSFATFAHDFEGVLEGFEYLFSHELMHHWIGTAIQNDEPEELKYWFSEGFTDYFTQRILRECGFVDQQGFASNINKILMAHHASPVREAANQEIRSKFWQDQEFEKLPYRRGTILALFLDGAIKRHSQNKHQLKDAMEDLLRICKKERLLLSDSLFLATMKDYLDRDLKEFMKVHIDQGRLIRLASHSLGPDYTLVYESVKEFDLGFDFEQSKPNERIVGVDPRSKAYEAGLRNGQQLSGYSISIGELTKPIELTVISNGRQKNIRYLPQKDKPELGQVPQFFYNPTSSEAAP